MLMTSTIGVDTKPVLYVINVFHINHVSLLGRFCELIKAYVSDHCMSHACSVIPY